VIADEIDVEETADKDLTLEDIINDAAQIKDKRFVTILKARHFTNPILTWRKLGKQLGISHERVRQIYEENIEKVRKHLKEKAR
jgi:DNA-directed RNA polymerase sigma subunit (sigma70/sigma32)